MGMSVGEREWVQFVGEQLLRRKRMYDSMGMCLGGGPVSCSRWLAMTVLVKEAKVMRPGLK